MTSPISPTPGRLPWEAVVLLVLGTLSPFLVAAIIVSCTATPVVLPEPPPVVLDAGPEHRQGGTSYVAANPAPCAVGTSCIAYADPATGAPAVSIVGGGITVPDGGLPVVFPDGGAVLANQGAPNAGGVQAWPVTDSLVEEATVQCPGLLSPTCVAPGAIQRLVAAGGYSDIDHSALSLSLVNTSGETGRAYSTGLNVQINGADAPLPIAGIVTLSGTTTTEGLTAVPVLSSSSALVSAYVAKSTGGAHVSTLVQVDASAPTGRYYVQMIKGSATCPGGGAVTFLHAPIAVDHTNGSTDAVNVLDGVAPATFTGGLCVALSSTQWTLTLTANYLVGDSTVY